MTSAVLAEPLDKPAETSIWKQRSFVIFCVVSFVCNAGGWMQSSAVPFLVYEWTHSPAWVGFTGFVAFFPSAVATIPGGVLADRFDKIRYLLVLQLIATVVTSILWFAAIADSLTLGLLLPLLAVQTTLLGLGVPAFQTVVGELVPRSDVARAINLNSAQAQLSKALAPVLAGLALAQLGASWAFGANAVSYAVIVIGLLFVSPLNRHDRVGRVGRLEKASRSFKALGHDLRAGWRQSWHHPSRRLAIVAIGAAMALGAPIYQLVAVIARENLDVGASAYGLLLSAFGIGAVLGNVVNGRLLKRPDGTRSKRLIGALAWYGIAITVVALSPWFAVTLAAMLLVGGGYLVVSVTLMTSIQLTTPPAFRARVVAIYSAAYIGGMPLGSLVQGWIAELTNVTVAVTLAGVGLLAMAFTLALHPNVARRLDGEQPDDFVDLTTSNSEASADVEGEALSRVCRRHRTHADGFVDEGTPARLKRRSK